MASGAPRVNRYLEDQSLRLQTDSSVVMASVLKAVKGNTDEPVYVGSESDFLNYFTPNGKIEANFDSGYWVIWNYLKLGTGAVLIQRAAKNATLGGSIPALLGTEQTYAETGAIPNADEYVFADNTIPFVFTGVDAGAYNNNITYDVLPYQTDEDLDNASVDENSHFTVSNLWYTGDSVYFLTLDGTLPAEIEENKSYYISLQEDGTVGLCETYQQSLVNDIIEITAGGTWLVKMIPNFTVEALPDTQVVQFKYKGVNLDSEKYMFSLKQDAVDNSNNSLWIEDIVAYSTTIKVIINSSFNFASVDTALMKKVVNATLAGGSDGDLVTDGELVTAVNKFKNTDTTSFKLMIDTGYASPTYHAAIASVLDTRANAIGLVSMPIGLEKSANAVEALINYANYSTNINTPYVSFFTPSVVVADEFNNARQIEISNIGFIASVYASVMSSLTPFKAPAGTDRGAMPSEILRLIKYFEWDKNTGGEFGRLYDARINPIRLIKNRGLVLWGQKNSQKLPSKTDRNNVIMVLITVGQDIEDFLNDFIFEDNTSTATYSEITELITAYMEEIKSKGGLDTRDDNGYAVIVDETVNTPAVINNNELVVLLRIKPASVGEFITLKIAVLSSGVSVTEA